MTARSLYEIATGQTKKLRRTGQPVRRNSYNVGEREARFWRPLNPREIGPRMKAAEHYERTNKKPGERNGPLGHVGLEVLRELYRLVHYRTGRLEPSLDYLMGRLRRSRAAVVRALAALREHGFVEWIRRTEPTDNDGAGPQIRQISNAYRFGIPTAALAFIRRVIGKAPPPEDDAHRRQSAAADTIAMIEALPVAERMRAMIDNPDLASALARMGALIEARQGMSASSPSGLNPGREG